MARRFVIPLAPQHIALQEYPDTIDETERRGGITKAGNPHARRLLVEAAWAYQGTARISRHLLLRQEALPKPICDIAWKAQLRLTSRFRKLVGRGKAKPKVATAVARELSGFVDVTGPICGADPSVSTRARQERAA